MSELENKHQAELEARKGAIDSNQMRLLLLAHVSALEEAADDLENKQLKQKLFLQQRMAKIRNEKTQKLSKNQESYLEAERERIFTEADDEQREKALEAEKAAAIEIMAKTV